MYVTKLKRFLDMALSYNAINFDNIIQFCSY